MTPLPRQVQRRMDDLERLTGVPATVSMPHPGHYLVEHSNERIHLTCLYQRNSQGRFGYKSTLHKDGQPRELVDGESAYARLFKDPDLEHPNRRPTSGLPAPVPVPEGELLPPLVESMVEVMPKLVASGNAAPGSVTWTLGFQRTPGEHQPAPAHGKGKEKKAAFKYKYVPHGSEPDTDRYVFELRKDNGDTVHMYFDPVSPGSDLYYFAEIAAVDKNNCDMMKEKDLSLNDLLEKLLGFRVPEAMVTPPKATLPNQRHSTASASTPNSVTVRRTTVIRN